MPSPELQRLFRLHEIDEGIRLAKSRLGVLDGGRAKIAELKAIKVDLDAAEALSRAVDAALTDAGLERTGLLDRAAKLEKELYSGKITGSREVEDRSRQIEGIRTQAATVEARVPELQAAVKTHRAVLEEHRAAFEAKRKEAAIEVKRQTLTGEKLGAALTDLEPKRADLARTIAPALLSRYEGIRQKHKGVGMAKVLPGMTCDACGNAVPERQVFSLIEDKVVTCEACYRILYYTTGVI